MRRSTPTQIPMIDPKTVEQRHRDGVSCRTVGGLLYNPDGPGIWCIDCDAPLGERSYVPGGADVPDAALGAAIVGLAFVLLLVVSLWYLLLSPATAQPSVGTDTRPTSVPTTIGPPGADPNCRACVSLPGVGR